VPYDSPDPSDPMKLVGIELPGTIEDERERAWVFCEEYARMGFSSERIWRLFRNPTYAGSHRALRILGETEVLAMIRETCAVWGNVRQTTIEPRADLADGAPRRLPVLDER